MVFRVILSEYEENVHHDLTLGESVRNDNPDAASRFTAEFIVRAVLDLRLPGDPGVSVRRDRIAIRHRERPRGMGEGEELMRERVRDEGIRELVLGAIRHVCKGSAKKLDKQLAKAREQAAAR